MDTSSEVSRIETDGFLYCLVSEEDGVTYIEKIDPETDKIVGIKLLSGWICPCGDLYPEPAPDSGRCGNCEMGPPYDKE